jgi:HAD superfamily hydrolase (TIGR01509 family)
MSDPKRAPRAVLWDMDGTLLDSSHFHWLAWRDTMASEGRPITREQFAASFGQRNDTILWGYFGEDLPSAEMDRIAEAKEERYRFLVRTQGVRLLPGVPHWLDRLRSEGWRQAVASAAPRRNIETILEVLDIGGYFGAIVSAEDVQHGKPDPQVFLTAASRVDVLPSRCVVVEDAPAGIEGARRAGMAAIGVQTSHPLDEGRAHLVVPTLDALPDDGFEQLVS